MEEDEDRFDWETRQEDVPFLHHALAGSAAGIMEHVSMFPVDTVKTRMQASEGKLSVRMAVQAVLNDKGALGFIRGSHVIGFGCIPAHVGLFGIYEFSMSKLVDKEELQPHRVAFCGAMGAIFHDSVLTPHDMVKQRLQLGRYLGAVDCIKSVWRTEGPYAFYRGLPAALAMNVPYTAMVTATNESMQKMLESNGGNSTTLTTISGYFLCAGFSGAVAAAVTSPLDVLKTRMQTQTKKGFLQLVSSTFSNEGFRGFFRGTLPRICLAAPAAGVSWGTYETVRLGLQMRSADNSRAQESAPIERKPSLKRIPSIRPTSEIDEAGKHRVKRQHSLNSTLAESGTVLRKP